METCKLETSVVKYADYEEYCGVQFLKCKFLGIQDIPAYFVRATVIILSNKNQYIS
jgi:hypothetical protein